MINIDFTKYISGVKYIYQPELWDTDDKFPVENVIIEKDISAIKFPSNRKGICYHQFTVPLNVEKGSFNTAIVYYPTGNTVGNIKICLHYKVFHEQDSSSSSSKSSSSSESSVVCRDNITLCEHIFLLYPISEVKLYECKYIKLELNPGDFVVLQLYRDPNVLNNYVEDFYLLDFILFQK